MLNKKVYSNNGYNSLTEASRERKDLKQLTGQNTLQQLRYGDCLVDKKLILDRAVERHLYQHVAIIRVEAKETTRPYLLSLVEVVAIYLVEGDLV